MTIGRAPRISFAAAQYAYDHASDSYGDPAQCSLCDRLDTEGVMRGSEFVCSQCADPCSACVYRRERPSNHCDFCDELEAGNG